MRDQPQEQGTDSGFTLVELIVYSALLILVLLGAGSLLIQSIKGQRTVVSVTQSSSEAQVAMTSVDLGVRNAAGGGVKIASPHVLVVHTGGGATESDFICQAWVYVPPGAGEAYGALWTKSLPVEDLRAESARLDALGSGLAGGGSPSGWLHLVDGVIPADGTLDGPIFTEVAPSVSTAFSTVQTNSANSGAGTKVSSITSPRIQAISGNGGCFS